MTVGVAAAAAQEYWQAVPLPSGLVAGAQLAAFVHDEVLIVWHSAALSHAGPAVFVLSCACAVQLDALPQLDQVPEYWHAVVAPGAQLLTSVQLLP